MWMFLTCDRRGCVQRVHADSIVDPARNSTRSATSDLHFRTPAGAPVRTAVPPRTHERPARLTYTPPEVA